MNQNTQTGVRTAPYLAGAVLAAIVVIVAAHLLGFHFVVAAGGSL